MSLDESDDKLPQLPPPVGNCQGHECVNLAEVHVWWPDKYLSMCLYCAKKLINYIWSIPSAKDSEEKEKPLCDNITCKLCPTAPLKYDIDLKDAPLCTKCQERDKHNSEYSQIIQKINARKKDGTWRRKEWILYK
jgi:hypothetical protein